MERPGVEINGAKNEIIALPLCVIAWLLHAAWRVSLL